MKNAIENKGGEIRLNSLVTRVKLENGKVKGIQTQGKSESFDGVVCTAPLSVVPKIIPDLPEDLLQAYNSINYIGVVCVIVKLKKPLTEYFWLNINDPNMDIPGLVEFSNIRPLENHIVYVPYYLPHDHPTFKETDQYYKEKITRYFEVMNPDLNDDDFIDFKEWRLKNVQPICGPGFLKKLLPIEMPIKGLWVADTSYYYPEDRGTSESVGLGRKIAKMVNSAMG